MNNKYQNSRTLVVLYPTCAHALSELLVALRFMHRLLSDLFSAVALYFRVSFPERKRFDKKYEHFGR